MTEEEKRVLKEAKHTRRQERNRRLSQIPFIRKYVRILLPLDLTVTAIFAWLDGTGYFQGHPKARMIEMVAFVLENALIIALLLGFPLMALSLLQLLRERKGLLKPLEKMLLYKIALMIALGFPVLLAIARGILQLFL